VLNLPLALRLEKNKLVSTAPWLVLLDLTLPDTSHIRLARNTDDVVFGGNTYSAFAFEVGEVQSGGDGRITGVNVRVANPARALQPYLEQYDGLIGCSVTLTVVHAGNLAADHSELALTWDVVAAAPAADWIDFTLGAVNPLRRRFPLLMAAPRSCPWIFKGAECGYAGAATACDRTLDDCSTLANTARFGGRPGITGAPRFV
jgi:lambda family phage minor tail protein L